MEEKKKTENIIFAIVLVAVVVGLFLVFKSVLGNSNTEEPKVDGKTIYNELQNESSLVTQKLIVKDVFQQETKGIPVFTKDKYLVSYKAEVRAGINMKDIEVNTNDKRVRVTIPHSEIQDISIPSKTIEIYNTGLTLFRANKGQLKIILKEAEKRAKKEATKLGMVDVADRNAEKVLFGLISEYANGRTVEIHFK